MNTRITSFVWVIESNANEFNKNSLLTAFSSQVIVFFCRKFRRRRYQVLGPSKATQDVPLRKTF